MEIKKSFEISFKELGKNKIIILPVLLSILIPIILTLVYIDISGLRDLIVDVNNKNLNEKTDIVKDIFSLFTVKNIVLLLIFLFIGIIFTIYLTCATFSLITLNIFKKELNFYDMISLTNKYFWKYISLNILYGLILGLPLLLIFLVVVLILLSGKILGIISVVVATILFFIYVIYIGLRLFFSIPILFVEKKSASQSLIYSFHITKGHLKQVFLIYAIIIGISLLSSQIAQNPLQDSIIDYLKSESIIRSIFYIFLILVFVLVEAFVTALEQLFFFYSYVDFRRIIK